MVSPPLFRGGVSRVVLCEEQPTTDTRKRPGIERLTDTKRVNPFFFAASFVFSELVNFFARASPTLDRIWLVS